MAKEKLVAEIDIKTARAMQALQAYRKSIKDADKDTKDSQTTAEEAGDGFAGMASKIALGFGAGGVAMLALKGLLTLMGDIRDRQKEILDQSTQMSAGTADFAAQMNSLADLFGTTQYEAGRRVKQRAVDTGLTPMGLKDLLFKLKSSEALTEENITLATGIASQALDPGQEGAAGAVVAMGKGALGYDDEQIRGFANRVYRAAKTSQWNMMQMMEQFGRVAPLKEATGMTDEQLLQMLQKMSGIFPQSPRKGGMAVKQIIEAALTPSEEMETQLTARGLDPYEATTPEIIDTLVMTIAEAKRKGGTYGVGEQLQKYQVAKAALPGVLELGLSKEWQAKRISGDPVLIEAAERRRREETVRFQQARYDAQLAEYESGKEWMPLATEMQYGKAAALRSGSTWDVNVKALAGKQVPGFGQIFGAGAEKGAPNWLRFTVESLFRRAQQLRMMYGGDPRLATVWALLPHQSPVERPAQFEFWLTERPDAMRDINTAARLIRDMEASPPTEFIPIDEPVEPGPAVGVGIGPAFYRPPIPSIWPTVPGQGAVRQQTAPISQTTPGIVNHNYYGFTPINMRSRRDFYTPTGGNEWAN